jgi:hypothetical protein
MLFPAKVSPPSGGETKAELFKTNFHNPSRQGKRSGFQFWRILLYADIALDPEGGY